jgi:hypothetical protein
MRFQIEWVNHAAYILRAGDFELLTDPWLYGPVFQAGWDLVSETRHSLGALRRVRHVWISHEHPDHFNPHFFKGYSPAEKQAVTVYFQASKGTRLVSFLKGLGFRVVELPDGRPLRIDAEVELYCRKNGTADSWLGVTLGPHTVLNLNDCIFPDRRALEEIKQRYQSVDVLLTQFGYAEKVGNVRDSELRAAESRKWRALLVEHTKALNATFVIPFASYKFFSHAENYYMNDGASTPRQVLAALAEAGLADRCVVLYPGETWTLATDHDSEASIRKYEDDWARIDVRHELSRTYSADELRSAADEFLAKVRRVVSPVLLSMLRFSPLKFGLRPLTVRITDLDATFVLDARRGLRPAVERARAPDLSLASESLFNMLRFPYGANTLHVNGRFQSHNARALHTLFVWAHLGLMMGADLRLNAGYLLGNLARIAAFYVRRLPE